MKTSKYIIPILLVTLLLGGCGTTEHTYDMVCVESSTDGISTINLFEFNSFIDVRDDSTSLTCENIKRIDSTCYISNYLEGKEIPIKETFSDFSSGKKSKINCIEKKNAEYKTKEGYQGCVGLYNCIRDKREGKF